MFKLLTKKNRGFTLIELLVVIAIIGILSSVVLISMGNAKKLAQDAAMKEDMRAIITAEELYMNTNDKYSQSAGPNLPASISPGMAKTPVTPTATAYVWLKNDAGSTVCATDGTEFCAYATLTSSSKYYVAAHCGNFEKSTAPTTCTQCCQ